MSIQSEINRILGNVADAYSALSEKGATMPSVLNTANLKSTIESIEMMTAEAMSIETIWAICGYDPNALPSGYTLLEYIQSSGTQYIDTGFKPNNNTRVAMDALFATAPSTTSALFGARVSATDRNYALIWSSSGAFRSDYNNVYTQTWSVAANTRRVYDKDGETTTIDGTAQAYTNATFQTPYSLYLCASNNAGTASWLSPLRIYSCQLYDNGTLVRDFVPCKNSNGVFGMYDMVNAQFYANAGSGSFTGA